MSGQMLWADGGLAHNAPRDTLPAYWGALGAGADGLMIPVQLAKGRKPVCVPGPDLKATTGVAKPVGALTARQIRGLDAGATFVSQALDAEFKPRSRPSAQTPWIAHRGKHDALYHPSLDEVFRLFARRTQFLLCLLPDKGKERQLADAVLQALEDYAAGGRTLLGGSAAMLAAVGDRHNGLCLIPDRPDALAPAAAEAGARGYHYVLASDTVPEAAWVKDATFRLILVGGEGRRAIRPAVYEAVAGNPFIAGFAVQAVDDFRAYVDRRGLIAADAFEGKRADRDLWTLGHSRPNKDTKIWVDDGLHIRVDGPNYSGAAALTSYSIFGDFDARMAFEVKNPKQGTTFELAAIHVDPGYREQNLTFDVHGAPPYASSERDEDDGFRIGWNNGPALTQWVDYEPRSSNLYNNYGRNVGYAKKDSPKGKLRLTRRGDVFNAYYRDKFHEAWVLSGSVPVPALADAVFLRLGAKHWPKHGNPAPANRFTFTDFELYQRG